MSANGRRHPGSLALLEFSDRELLNLVLDVADDDGWTNAVEVAEAIGIDAKHATRCVGSRFAWMRRYGVMQREETTGRWRLTPAGLRIALGQLDADEAAALKRLSPEQLMEATSLLTSKYRRVNPVAATMMRRAWMYGTARR